MVSEYTIKYFTLNYSNWNTFPPFFLHKCLAKAVCLTNALFLQNSLLRISVQNLTLNKLSTSERWSYVLFTMKAQKQFLLPNIIRDNSLFWFYSVITYIHIIAQFSILRTPVVCHHMVQISYNKVFPSSTRAPLPAALT